MPAPIKPGNHETVIQKHTQVLLQFHKINKWSNRQTFQPTELSNPEGEFAPDLIKLKLLVEQLVPKKHMISQLKIDSKCKSQACLTTGTGKWYVVSIDITMIWTHLNNQT